MDDNRRAHNNAEKMGVLILTSKKNEDNKKVPGDRREDTSCGHGLSRRPLRGGKISYELSWRVKAMINKNKKKVRFTRNDYRNFFFRVYYY